MLNRNPFKSVVMVIDDDEINLLLAKTILEKKLRCKVITAESGVKGIEMLRREDVNVLLLDIDMPLMDGFETLRRIREEASLKDLPVIMLTAAADKETVVKVAKQGIEGYIKKPFMPDELIARVQNFI
ncbi:MAG: response regulator [Selenomonadaceae bacterium]|nr:response regulator [Selenomonadaceae bacterium]MBP3723564.1 response regulator [Selenomonadaceae bacterium]